MLAPFALIGHWRIVEADIRNRDHLDLGGPAIMTIAVDHHGETALACQNGNEAILRGT